MTVLIRRLGLIFTLAFSINSANAQFGPEFNAFLDTCNNGGHYSCASFTDANERSNCCFREALARHPSDDISGNSGTLSDDAIANYNQTLNACVQSGHFDCAETDSEGNRTPLTGSALESCCRRVAMNEANPFAYDANQVANLDDGSHACDNPLANQGELGLQVGPICNAAEAHEKAAIANTALAVTWLWPLWACTQACTAATAGDFTGHCKTASLLTGAGDFATVLTVQEEMKEIQGGLAVLAGASSINAFSIGSGTWGAVAGAGEAIGSAFSSGGSEIPSMTTGGGSSAGAVSPITSGGSLPDWPSGVDGLPSSAPAPGEAWPDISDEAFGNLTDQQREAVQAHYDNYVENHEVTKAKNAKEQNAACGAAIYAAAKVAVNGIGAKINRDKEKDKKAEADELFVNREDEIRSQGEDSQIRARLNDRNVGNAGGRRFPTNNLGDGNGSGGGFSPFGDCPDPTEACAVAVDNQLAPFFSQPNAREQLEEVLGGNLNEMIKQADANNATAGDLISGALGGGDPQRMAAGKAVFDDIAQRAGKRISGSSNQLASSTYSGGGGSRGGGSSKKGNSITRGLSSLFNKAKGLVTGKAKETSFEGLSYNEIFSNRSLSLFTRHETRLKSVFKKDRLKNLPWATPYNMTVTEE